jgi:DNA-binding GntR family transcriptional regulator
MEEGLNEERRHPARVANKAHGGKPAQRRTLVEVVVDAIVAAAARGVILPGDRIVEADIARELSVSRVPVREALRLLESQGLVVSLPYKGVRLRPVTRQRLEQLSEVRMALEKAAAKRIIGLGKNRGPAVAPLEQRIVELERMAAGQDIYGVASADAAFHRELCRLSENEVLCAVWETLARQLTVIVGLSTLSKPMQSLVNEHRMLFEELQRGSLSELDEAMEEHIRIQNDVVDFEAIIAERRRLRDLAAARQQRAPARVALSVRRRSPGGAP